MKIMSVVRPIAVLLVAGLAIAMLTGPGAQAGGQTPLISINDHFLASNQAVKVAGNSSAMHNFTITVDARVDGKKMPIADAMVFIYSDATTNTTTIVLQKVSQNRTDANGVVNFNYCEREV